MASQEERWQREPAEELRREARQKEREARWQKRSAEGLRLKTGNKEQVARWQRMQAERESQNAERWKRAEERKERAAERLRQETEYRNQEAEEDRTFHEECRNLEAVEKKKHEELHKQGTDQEESQESSKIKTFEIWRRDDIQRAKGKQLGKDYHEYTQPDSSKTAGNCPCRGCDMIRENRIADIEELEVREVSGLYDEYLNWKWGNSTA